MKPVTVTIDVPQSREAVYDFLDVMSNHELFTDHIMQDWHFEGPARGIGSKSRLKAVVGGRTEAVEIEVIEAERPVKTVERNVGAGGKRVGTGTYTLADLPDGGTRVTFTYAWQQAPWNERLAEPVVRGIARRGFERAMQRLAEQLSLA
jgi:Polyketide cyclase / dehydrase and lipid transport